MSESKRTMSAGDLANELSEMLQRISHIFHAYNSTDTTVWQAELEVVLESARSLPAIMEATTSVVGSVHRAMLWHFEIC